MKIHGRRSIDLLVFNPLYDIAMVAINTVSIAAIAAIFTGLKNKQKAVKM